MVRSTQVVAVEPASSTSPSEVEKRAVAGPRTTTLVSASDSLTSTKPGSSRRPSEIRASSTSSNPAPSSTSCHRWATRPFSDGGSTTIAWSPKIPNHAPGR
jgi:hypothetical protein